MAQTPSISNSPSMPLDNNDLTNRLAKIEARLAELEKIPVVEPIKGLPVSCKHISWSKWRPEGLLSITGQTRECLECGFIERKNISHF